MIAANFRKHPDAMALQLPLPFGHALIWHTARPGSRILRTLRAARSHAFRLAGRIAWPVKQAAPRWWKEAKKRARDLAHQVREACQALMAEIRIADTDPPRLFDFNYADPAWPKTSAPASATAPNKYRQRVLRTRANKLGLTHYYPDGCPACDACWVYDQPAPTLTGTGSTWHQCASCGVSWDPAGDRAQIKRELAGDDDDSLDADD